VVRKARQVNNVIFCVYNLCTLQLSRAIDDWRIAIWTSHEPLGRWSL
jgi:hypothetical protein